MVDDTGLEPVTSRTSSAILDFFNIFCLFIAVSAPSDLTFNTFGEWEFHCFRGRLWLVMWSSSNSACLRLFPVIVFQVDSVGTN